MVSTQNVKTLAGNMQSARAPEVAPVYKRRSLKLEIRTGPGVRVEVLPTVPRSLRFFLRGATLVRKQTSTSSFLRRCSSIFAFSDIGTFNGTNMCEVAKMNVPLEQTFILEGGCLHNVCSSNTFLRDSRPTSIHLHHLSTRLPFSSLATKSNS